MLEPESTKTLRTSRESLDALVHSINSISNENSEEMIESIKSIRYSLNSIALSLNGILELKLQKAKQNTNIIISTRVMNEIERMKDDAADLLS